MDSYDRLIGKTLFEMKFNYYDNALREYSKDNIWFLSYNQLKYGIENTCQYSYLKKCEQNYLYECLLHTMDPNKALSKLKKYFEKYPDSRFHEALIDLHARNDENYDHQYFDESLQTLIDLENYLIFKQINM